MRTREHSVTILGPAVRDSGATPIAAGGVLSMIGTSLHGAVDMAFRGSSSSGRRQRWLRDAGNAEFVDAQKTAAEEMTLYFLAPVFEDVATKYFQQPTLFDDGPHKEDTSFDVLADSVRDVVDGIEDSQRFDDGLLRRFQTFDAKVFRHHIDEVLISDHRNDRKAPCAIKPSFPNKARTLSQRTPTPQRARIAGKLDLIQASTLAFQLLLPSGDRVRGVWKHEFETLRKLANTEVVATGMAIYRPSGTLLRIDADSMSPQSASDSFFASIPTPPRGRLEVRSLVHAQRKRGGMTALWQSIPAEESDDEFLDALASMS